MDDFDPDEAADGDGLFGLPHGPDEAQVHVIPVPWEGTVSFGAGTAAAPAAVLEASKQVDLHHLFYGDLIWKAGLYLEPAAPHFAHWASQPVPRDPALINPRSQRVDEGVKARVSQVLDMKRIPGLLGGEHSIAFGGIQAALQREPNLGILHIDAHGDLRPAYEGFSRSHASIFYNLLEGGPETLRLVQVGVRDLGKCEQERIMEDSRIRCFFDGDLMQAWAEAVPWNRLVETILAKLPDTVWISLDVDGLNPQLCPGTGTPVPGGLSWHQVTSLLQSLGASGRRVMGFDLCEVGAGTWDANVGARLLLELAGAALASRR